MGARASRVELHAKRAGQPLQQQRAPPALRQQQICSVCRDPPEQRAALPCQHIVCRDCWAGWEAQLHSHREPSTCPECRVEVNPPPRDVVAVPRDFAYGVPLANRELMRLTGRVGEYDLTGREADLTHDRARLNRLLRLLPEALVTDLAADRPPADLEGVLRDIVESAVERAEDPAPLAELADPNLLALFARAVLTHPPSEAQQFYYHPASFAAAPPLEPWVAPAVVGVDPRSVLEERLWMFHRSRGLRSGASIARYSQDRRLLARISDIDRRLQTDLVLLHTGDWLNPGERAMRVWRSLLEDAGHHTIVEPILNRLSSSAYKRVGRAILEGRRPDLGRHRHRLPRGLAGRIWALAQPVGRFVRAATWGPARTMQELVRLVGEYWDTTEASLLLHRSVQSGEFAPTDEFLEMLGRINVARGADDWLPRVLVCRNWPVFVRATLEAGPELAPQWTETAAEWPEVAEVVADAVAEFSSDPDWVRRGEQYRRARPDRFGGGLLW